MAKKTAKPAQDAAVIEAETVITEEAEPATGGEKRMYEVMLVLKPDLIESNLQKKLRDFKKYLEDHGCKVTEEDIWEKRRLAYKIKQYGEGIYAVYNFESLSSFIHELENYLRIDNDVIRHLVITLHADYKYIKFREEPEEEKPARKEKYAPRGTTGGRPEDRAPKKLKEEIKEIKKEEETKLVSTEPPETVSGEKEPKKEKKEGLLSKLLKKKPKEEVKEEKPEKKKEEIKEQAEEEPKKEKKEEKISRSQLDEKLDKLLGGDDLNI